MFLEKGKKKYGLIHFTFYFLLLLAILQPDIKAQQSFPAEKLNIKMADIPIFVKSQEKELTINDASGYKGVFTGGPYVNLTRGTYKVTVKYQADTNDNYVEFFAVGKPLAAELYRGESLFLPAGQGQKEFYLDLTENIFALDVRTYFSGQGSFSIAAIEIERAAVPWQDKCFLTVLLTVVYGLFLWFCYVNTRWWKCSGRRNAAVFLGILLLFLNYPLLSNHISSGNDDIMFHLNRIEGIKDGLLDGQFPVRVHPATGDYGYAAPVLYPELFLYIPALLRLAGVSMTVSYGFYLFLFNVLTVIIAYYSFSRLARSRLVGIWAAILYATAFYRIASLSYRSALGEWSAIAFLPLAVLGLYNLLWGKPEKWKYAVLGYTGVLQSHILTMAVLSAGSVALAIIGGRRLFANRRWLFFLKACGMTLLINAWFIVPFVSLYSEDLYVKHAVFDVSSYALSVGALLSTSSVLSIENKDIMLFIQTRVKLGITLIMGVIFFLLAYKNCPRLWQTCGKVGLAIGGIFLYMVSNLFPWDILEQLPYLGTKVGILQVPWRLLLFVSLALSLTGAIGLVAFARQRRIMPWFSCCIIFVCYFSAQPLIDRYLTDRPLLYAYEAFVPYRNGVGWGEYYYNGTDQQQLRERTTTYVPSDSTVKVTNAEKSGTSIYFSYQQAYSGGYVDVPLVAYPFYRAYDEGGKSLKLRAGENNLLRVDLPQPQGSIRIRYEEKWSWRLAVLLSGLTVVSGLIVWGLRWRRVKA